MTQRPHRIQLRRTKGWRMPPNTVKVDRTTKWGNPWRVVTRSADHRYLWHVCRDGGGLSEPFDTRRAALNDAVDRFREFATSFSARDLRGKNLACWCALDQPCHADVLLEIANREVAA